MGRLFLGGLEVTHMSLALKPVAVILNHGFLGLLLAQTRTICEYAIERYVNCANTFLH